MATTAFEKTLRVRGLAKRFGDKQVLAGVDMDIPAGQVSIITGPSGVGKTTFIRCLSGLESYDAGEILPKEAVIGMVFQEFNLFPHLTAAGNIALALEKARGMNQRTAAEKAKALLGQLGLAGHEGQYPFQLSGGQRQRVAIARAMAMEPDYLCFDEPTSALDSKLRDSVGALLRRLAQTGMGIVVISHDAAFSKQFADRLYSMEAGRLQQQNKATFFAPPAEEETESSPVAEDL